MSKSTDQIETLVYSWADTTLAGIGFGVVALTDGWRWTTAPERADLAGVLKPDRLDDGERTFAYLPTTPFGPALALRRDLGLDRSGRGGRVVVELHVAGDRPLTAAEALLLAARRLPVLDWPVDAVPTRVLPHPSREHVPAGAIVTPSVLAALLDAASGRSAQSSAGLAELAAGFDALPTTLCCRIGVASSNDALRDQVTLTVDDNGQDASEAAQQLTRRLLALNERAPDGISSVQELERWVLRRERERTPIPALSDGELIDMLRTEESEARRDALAAEYAERVVSSGYSLLRTPGQRLALNTAAGDAVRDAIVTRSADSAQAFAAARTWGVKDTVLAPSAMRLLSDHIRVDSDPDAQATLAPFVQDYVAASGPRITSVMGRGWLSRALVMSWGSGSEALTRAFWTEGQAPPEGIGKLAGVLLAAHPEHTVMVVRGADPAPERLAAAISRLPETYIAQSSTTLGQILSGGSAAAAAQQHRTAPASPVTDHPWPTIPLERPPMAPVAPYSFDENLPAHNGSVLRTLALGAATLTSVLAVFGVFGPPAWSIAAAAAAAGTAVLLLVDSRSRPAHPNRR
ncbi:hypothetical protein SCB71_21155 (plasmid) [Herbiconiux sp. KACC 21604]|uniref:hypothetical protein n=1 Tax=unclassified Herbiconiux TaxID=2618217 RepID=UPI001491BCC2|nr:MULTISPECIES: hypothetical protein [unclassified Herbiconiux]QJU56254.1 hypothetical protein HL652_20950 [Herbiconiux sp. SALV-R1]WPO88868.1 hypothetical protein SCB71_21155 [Herbiconiux sp. KACC 21604]